MDEVVSAHGEKIEIPAELNRLLQVEGISLAEGLYFCGSAGALLKFLDTFYKSIDGKAAEIEEAFARQDFETYTIKVHSLKSTSRIIGAAELSKLAQTLEIAGNDGDISYIKENTNKLLDLYRSYRERLSVLEEIEKEKEDDKTPISPGNLADAYSALREMIPLCDYDAVEMILSELNEYRLPEKDKKLMVKLEELLKKMDWDSMQSII